MVAFWLKRHMKVLCTGWVALTEMKTDKLLFFYLPNHRLRLWNRSSGTLASPSLLTHHLILAYSFYFISWILWWFKSFCDFQLIFFFLDTSDVERKKKKKKILLWLFGCFMVETGVIQWGNNIALGLSFLWLAYEREGGFMSCAQCKGSSTEGAYSVD